MVLDEQQRPVVERVFRAFAAGQPRRQIAAALNEDGLPTMRGGLWRPATVTRILTNPVYVGKIADPDGELFDGTHAALIADELWTQVQTLVQAQATPRGKGRGRVPKNHLFVRGLLRCGECGEAMVPRTAYGRKGQPSTEWYTCNQYISLGGDSTCKMRSLRRDELDAAVYAYFEEVGLDVEATRAAMAEAVSHRLAEAQALRQAAEREAQRADERLARVRRDYQDGKLDADDWTEQRQQLTEEAQGADAEADRLRASEAEVLRDGAAHDAEQEVLEQLARIRQAVAGEVADAEGVNAVRAALTRLFESFTVSLPVDGKAQVRPKRRAATIAYDLTDMEAPKVQLTSPERVALSAVATKTFRARPSN